MGSSVLLSQRGYHDQANDGVKYQLNKMKYVLKSKTVHKEMVELIVEVKLTGDNTAFVQDISEVEGVKNVSLVSYAGDYAP
ncbi:hypothetical protein [Brevibacillus antibioticus]|uniref:hypothetical protein n=1 Tax=Brevibacillus antibioticus TaxID=2570228 RepID=UPI001FCAAE86|nr:hypothetical protein [Brevibacillus antibioticus]